MMYIGVLFIWNTDEESCGERDKFSSGRDVKDEHNRLFYALWNL